MKYTMNHFG